MTFARIASLLAMCALMAAACSNAQRSTKVHRASHAATATLSQHNALLPKSRSDWLYNAVHGTPDDLLVGQLITTKLDGQVLSTDEKVALRSGHVGGVILFGYNVTSLQQLRRFTGSIAKEGSLGSLMRTKPFVMADQEGGSTRAISQLPPAASQPVMGRRADANATEQQSAAAARAIRAAGVNVNLAPVADVDSSGSSAHVMRDRVYGSDPGKVGDQISAAVTGYQHGDLVAATAKHFPGLGAGTLNTDMGVSHVRLSRDEVVRDAAPFQRAIDAHVDFVMTSHAIYDGLGSKVPASLDHAIATDLLRGMGFQGVVISDSMNARGLRVGGHTTVPQACPRALIAGVDVVLLTGSLETARLCHRRVMEALANGSLTHEQLELAVMRVMALKLRLGLAPSGSPG